MQLSVIDMWPKSTYSFIKLWYISLIILSIESLRSRARNRLLAVSNDDPKRFGSDLKGNETLKRPDGKRRTESFNFPHIFVATHCKLLLFRF